MYIDQLISNYNHSQYVYLIEHGLKLGWFLQEYQLSPARAVWFPRANRAFRFVSEEDVEEFKSVYMAPRQVSIVRVEYSQITY